jgi:hypothetical protein
MTITGIDKLRVCEHWAPRKIYTQQQNTMAQEPIETATQAFMTNVVRFMPRAR